MIKAGGPSTPGALVLSLDFELWWGVRDHAEPGEEVTARLLGARAAIARLLELFEEFEIAATWATVGFLFAESRDDLERIAPRVRPHYEDQHLSPYHDPLGLGEEDDPIRFAPSLVRAIVRTPRQELGTHTFSHYYCGEPGQTGEAFRADLAAARLAAERHGVSLRSIVFPRNQHNREYDDILLELGIRAYRGNPDSGCWTFGNARESRRTWKRLGRLAESYVGSADANLVDWSEVVQPNGLSNVRASGVLRPYHPALRHLEGIRLARIRRSLRAAAKTGRILHLWWHPHNFGLHTEENLAFLRSLLREFAICRSSSGMLSLSMAEVDELARARRGSDATEALVGAPHHRVG